MTATATTWNSCFCSCHSVIPVFINDRIHAATACTDCYKDHVQRYVKEDEPPKPKPDTSTAWTEQGDGEGRE
jgi:hypothetical protein